MKYVGCLNFCNVIIKTELCTMIERNPYFTRERLIIKNNSYKDQRVKFYRQPFTMTFRLRTLFIFTIRFCRIPLCLMYFLCKPILL